MCYVEADLKVLYQETDRKMSYHIASVVVVKGSFMIQLHAREEDNTPLGRPSINLLYSHILLAASTNSVCSG